MMNEKIIGTIFILFLTILGIFYMYLASQTKLLGEDEIEFLDLGTSFSKFQYPAFDALNRPIQFSPFASLVFAIPFMLFGPSLALAKMIIAIFGILTLLIVYLIGKKINIWYGIVSAFLLLSAYLFSHFMFLVYLEVPIAFFSALATYMFFKLDSYRRVALTGVVMALAFYTKQTGLFLNAGLLIYALLLYFYQKNKNYLKMAILAILISGVLSSIFIFRNILLYNYPYTFFLNSFFKLPPGTVIWPGVTGQVLSMPLITIIEYAGNLSWLIILSVIFSVALLSVEFQNKKASIELAPSLILLVLFLILYYIFYFLGMGIAEPRNIFIIFPQFALIGGYFIFKVKEHYKRFGTALIILVVVVSLYLSVSTAVGTANHQRYPDNYIEALTWIKNNTPKNTLILSTYGGSAKYFSEREVVWVIQELPEVMSTNNTTFIHEAMKKYNVSYILVWRGTLANQFIIPASNIYGAFTYNFLNQVISDSKDFPIAYQNQDNIVFKVNQTN